MASRTAKATLIGAVLFSTLTIWAVHFQQQQERDVGLRSDTHFQFWFYLSLSQTMYKGVLRDDERRREKLRQREEDLRASQHKREWYEQVQKVKKASDV